jgi:hypothetical protein
MRRKDILARKYYLHGKILTKTSVEETERLFAIWIAVLNLVASFLNE